MNQSDTFADGAQPLQLRCFHATKGGCKLAGLNAARTREALGGQP